MLCPFAIHVRTYSSLLRTDLRPQSAHRSYSPFRFRQRISPLLQRKTNSRPEKNQHLNFLLCTSLGGFSRLTGDAPLRGSVTGRPPTPPPPSEPTSRHLHLAADGAEPPNIVPVQGTVDKARHIRGEALLGGGGRRGRGYPSGEGWRVYVRIIVPMHAGLGREKISGDWRRGRKQCKGGLCYGRKIAERRANFGHDVQIEVSRQERKLFPSTPFLLSHSWQVIEFETSRLLPL